MISQVKTIDARFPIGSGHGSDAIHRDPIYSYATTLLIDDSGITGSGLAFTLGEGNHLVCKAAEFYAQALVGKDIDSVMADFGNIQRQMADEQQFRWLGPHKGVVQLALASVTNACWDLWAKKHHVPLWKLLIDLDEDTILQTLDLSHLEDELDITTAKHLLSEARKSKSERLPIIDSGYPGYDTSIGWFNYSDEQVAENVARSAAEGFTAMKLKVGSPDLARDIRRTEIVRKSAGRDVLLMVDANQQWSIQQALDFANSVKEFDLYWLEEPTHPDDLLGHKTIASEISPIKVAAGEHLPNRVVFKNYLQAGALQICQVDAVRVAGVSEFIVVSLLAKKFGVPVIPHVGDMGQLHQHLVLFNHIALNHPAIFLEHIPHLQEHFVEPVVIRSGRYLTPTTPGSCCDLKIAAQ